MICDSFYITKGCPPLYIASAFKQPKSILCLKTVGLEFVELLPVWFSMKQQRSLVHVVDESKAKPTC